MPNWSQALKGLGARASTTAYRHPILTTALGAGLGAGAGKLVAPEEQEGLGTRLGLLAGAAGSFAHPAVRKAFANWVRRQAHAYTGRIPKAFKNNPEEYIKSIQSYGTQNPYVSMFSKMWRPVQERVTHPAQQWRAKTWEKLRRAAGRPAREVDVPKLPPLEPGKPMDEILAKYHAGMSSIPDQFRTLIKDPRGFGKKWWEHGGRETAMQVPLFTLPTIYGMRGRSPEERKKTMADTVGGTAGWLAFAGLPSSVWMPASMIGGHLAGRMVGDRTVEPKRFGKITR